MAVRAETSSASGCYDIVGRETMKSKGKVDSIRKVRRDGSIEWRNKKGELHREDGPAREWPAKNARAWYRNGKLHREDGPASEGPLGRIWHLNGKKHRVDGPAVELADGSKQWFWHGKLHREDGPAEEGSDGRTSWYRHGRLHREDGPAAEEPEGRFWYRNGKRHRGDGPAIERADGMTEWYIKGVQLSPEQIRAVMKRNGDKAAEPFLKGLDHEVTLARPMKVKKP